MLQARVRRNDARILASAVNLAAVGGWSGVTLAGVGRAAGLTISPVRDRYRTRGRLGAAAWTEVAGSALHSALAEALATAGLLDSPANEVGFANAMDAMTRPGTDLRAAAELAVVSCFEGDIAEAVAASLGTAMRTWLDPARAGDPARAAKRGYLLALALGLLAVAHRPGIPNLSFGPQWRRLLAALGTDLGRVDLPDEPRPPHLTFIPFDTGDAMTDDLLRAAIEQLGRHGYEGSILASVAAETGASAASVFVRYPSKEAFFMDAINRQQDITFPAQREYLARLERTYGTGIAEAIAIRGTMHPSERAINVIEMERARLTWHRPNLAAADEERLQEVVREALAQDPTSPDFTDPARIHLARALGIGIAFLPLLCDKAWDLPYEVVTIAMNEA
jgi:AcrR family transcriptional regulator